MNTPLPIALCNEVLQPLPFEAQCRMAAALGYDGLEVAPFTLAADPSKISHAQAGVYRRMAEDQGLKIFGLHWLLVAPEGLSVVTGDRQLRAQTAAVMERLVELCALLGGGYLVHGSPRQRNVPARTTPQVALDRAVECFERAARAAERVGVIYCLEPLSTRETDLINTVGEAMRVVDQIASPAFKTMIDCSAAGQMESLTIERLMALWMPRGHIAHVQLNDPNRRGPGQGEMAFAPILETLLQMKAMGHYEGIVSVEPFDYVPDGPGAAAHAIGYLKGVLQGLAAHD